MSLMTFKGLNEGEYFEFDPQRCNIDLDGPRIIVNTFDGDTFILDVSEFKRLQEAFDAPR